MLRLVLGDFTASLEELIEISESKTIHIQNLQSLMTEVYKCLNRYKSGIYVVNVSNEKYPIQTSNFKSTCITTNQFF